jgi:hypothetical protein
MEDRRNDQTWQRKRSKKLHHDGINGDDDDDNVLSLVYKKVKESRKRPGVAQRVPGGLGSQIS